jgi:hypothetical protein
MKMRSAIGWAVVVSLSSWTTVACAQDLLANPDFDQDVAGWSLFVGESLAWAGDDEGACPASGSLVVASAPFPGSSFTAAIASQCFPVDGQTEVAASISFRDGAPFQQVGVRFHTSSDCSDANPPSALSPVAAASPGVWSRMEMPASAIPAGTNSLQFLAGGSDVGGGDFVIELDRAYIGTPDRVFAADFETDTDGAPTPCRWSPASP